MLFEYQGMKMFLWHTYLSTLCITLINQGATRIPHSQSHKVLSFHLIFIFKNLSTKINHNSCIAWWLQKKQLHHQNQQERILLQKYFHFWCLSKILTCHYENNLLLSSLSKFSVKTELECFTYQNRDKDITSWYLPQNTLI